MFEWTVCDIVFNFCIFQLRPPQPSVFLFVLDVSFNALETGRYFLTAFV